MGATTTDGTQETIRQGDSRQRQSLAFFLAEQAEKEPQGRAGQATCPPYPLGRAQHSGSIPALPKWGRYFLHCLGFVHCLQLSCWLGTRIPAVYKHWVYAFYRCVEKATDPVTSSNWPCVLGLSLVFCAYPGHLALPVSTLPAPQLRVGWGFLGGDGLGTSNPAG